MTVVVAGPTETTDLVVRFVVADGAARVVVVVATDLAREAARRHAASGAAALAMGRAGAAALLLATLTKGDERITLQILGNGPLGALTVDASSTGAARMFVGNPRVTLFAGDSVRPRLGAAVGQTGLVSVVRDLGMRETFKGQTPLADGEIDTDVERYLLDSEQIDSALGCEVFPDANGGIRFAAGILVQALPGGTGTELVATARQRLRAGTLATQLATHLATQTAAPAPESVAEIIARVTLGDDSVPLHRLDDVRPVRFDCPCSKDRAAATLALLGERDLAAMIQEEGEAHVTCEFCRSRYDFTDANLEEIRRDIQRRSPTVN
jgi:molecular chaperone Hsp33